ncbi:hypothetical protein HW555_003932 [Spodoptera exigua]|uniref:ISXO2-like transposase domain-containing protein n=1 Tax=Spodoptera exigua TaxID=7107 RepID=A0A835GL94_SPOEX|nr:hypothetical protein HW555_003932 [Spodoptera exigua]
MHTDNDQPSTSSALQSSNTGTLRLLSSSEESDDEDNEPLSALKARNNPREKSQAKKKRTTLWKKQLRQFSCTDYNPQPTSEESRNCKDPLEYFRLFFHKDLVKQIADQTNLYAGQRNKTLMVTEDEIYVILGAMLLSGYVKLPNKRLYFSKDNDVPKILAESIRCNRFEAILQNLHLNDNTHLSASSDRLYKLRPLLDTRYFNIWNFACAIRDEETAVAAAKAWLLIPARTPRCPICRGNMSREPKLSYKLKYRLRCWRCATEGRPPIRSPLKILFSKGYTVDESMIPYYGKQYFKQFIRGKPIKFGFKNWVMCASTGYMTPFSLYTGKSSEKKDFGLGGDVVLTLIELGKLPAQNGIKLYFDNFFTSLSLMRHLRGLGYYATGTIRANRVEKKIFVNFENWDLESATRWSHEKKAKVAIPQPSLIASYNKHMGGVDKCDQAVANLRTRMRIRKWWWPIFTFWLLARKNGCNKDTDSLFAFRRFVARCLLRTYGTAPHQGQKPAKPLSTTRYDGRQHWIIPISTEERRCVNKCGGKAKFKCTKCDIGLHPNSPDGEWTEETAILNHFPFTGTPEIKIPEASSKGPVDYIKSFFSIEFMTELAHVTNNHAQRLRRNSLKSYSRLNNWKNTSASELYTFLGIIICLGCLGLTKIADYWKKTYLHVTNHQQLNWLINSFNSIMKRLVYPEKELSIDKSMVGFRGRISLRQYIKSKRHKYGVKLYMLADPKWFVHRVHMYKGHSVYMDNFYNNVGLSEKLLLKKTYCTGTLANKRKNNPKTVVMKKLLKGGVMNLYRYNGKVISTEHSPGLLPVVNRRGSVDRHDEMLVYYPIDHKSIRWYKKNVMARNFNIWNYAAAICSEERATEAAKRWLLIPSQTVPILWRCRRAGCNVIRSPLKGTFFERSNVSILNTMRLLLHFFRKDKVSQAARDVGVCEVAEAHDRDMIGGDNDIVEVDETHLYTNKYHRGRLLQRQTWSYGCISRLTKKIHVELIPNKNRATLDPIIQQNVRQNSYIMSDQHRAYMGVHLRLGMRGHSSVNHSPQFTAGTVNIPVDPSLGIPVPGSSNVRCKVHTNTIERQWLELKRQCRTCRSQRRLKWYMGEYMYRQNILKSLPSDAARFRRLLRDIHRIYQLTSTTKGCGLKCPKRVQKSVSPTSMPAPSSRGRNLEKDLVQWKSDKMELYDKNNFQFMGNANLPDTIQQLESPADFFGFLFTDDMIELIIEQSNIKSVQENINKPAAITKKEMEQFIGIVIFMSCVKCASNENVLSKHIGQAHVYEVMTCNRFEVIKQFLHFNNNDNFKPFGTDGHDKLFKIRPLLNQIRERTVRLNRVANSNMPSEKELKKKGRGSYEEKIAIVDDVKLSLVSWFDNKNVNILSSYVGSEPTTTKRRYSRKEKKSLCDGRFPNQVAGEGRPVNDFIRDEVLEAVSANPSISVRGIEADTGIPKSTAHSILQKEEYHPTWGIVGIQLDARFLDTLYNEMEVGETEEDCDKVELGQRRFLGTYDR